MDPFANRFYTLDSGTYRDNFGFLRLESPASDPRRRTYIDHLDLYAAWITLDCGSFRHASQECRLGRIALRFGSVAHGTSISILDLVVADQHSVCEREGVRVFIHLQWAPHRDCCTESLARPHLRPTSLDREHRRVLDAAPLCGRHRFPLALETVPCPNGRRKAGLPQLTPRR